MPRGSGSKGRSPFCHIKSKQRKVRQLWSFEDVVSRELGAPYTVQHLPYTDQIVLRPVAGEGGANPTAPSMWEKTVAAVWCIRSLHLSKTEAQYPTRHVVEGVPWVTVWATMQRVAQPSAEGFVAMPGEGVELYGVTKAVAAPT